VKIELKKHLREKGKALHRLIRSLTPGQNIGFRPQLPAKRQQIYDLYRKMEVYDESIITAAFPEDTQEGLHRAKSILFDEVIKYIVDFAPFNGRRDLYRLLTEAKHMRETGMDAVALVRINDAIRLAVGMEAVTELLEAIKVRRKLIGAVEPSKRNDDNFLELEEWAIAGSEETTRIDRLEASLYRLSLLPAAEHYAQVGELETMLNETPFPVLVRNQMQYRRVRYYIARQRRDIPICIQESEAIYQLGNANKHVLVDTDVRETYFHAITFLAVSASEAKDFRAAEHYLDRIKTLSKAWGGGLEANPSLNARYLFSSTVAKIYTKDWKAAYELAKRVYQDVVKRKVLNNVSMQASVLRIALYAAFLNQDYALTRRIAFSLQSGLDTSNNKASSVHSAAFVSLLTLLSYLEQGDPYIRSATKELGSWMKSLGPLGPYENTILGFFKKVGEDTAYTATPSSLLMLRDELITLFKDPQFGKYQSMFPLQIWVEAKLTGRDMRTFELP
jgi:hypothetical protein